MTKSEIETAIDEQAAEVGLDLGMRRDAFQDLPCGRQFRRPDPIVTSA